jgi:hypothetical protein
VALGGINYFLRTVVWAGLLGLLGWGAWETRGVLQARDELLAERDGQIADLTADLALRDARIADLERAVEELQLALQFIKVDHRLARLSVLEQGPPDAAGRVSTKVRFQEVGPDGAPLAPGKDFVLDGKLAYVDALVIKFDDRYVERGDVWRGTSICLFRRFFSENQRPEDGFPLDPTGKRPAPYADESDEGADRELWLRFWDYANDAALAEQVGVRAIHGEAPYVELRPGRSYRIELRASGGLSIRPE